MVTAENIIEYQPWPVNLQEASEWEAIHGQRWTKQIAGWAAAVMTRGMRHRDATEICCGFEKSEAVYFSSIDEMKAHIEIRLAAGDWLTFYKHPKPQGGCIHWMNSESSWSASRFGLMF